MLGERPQFVGGEAKAHAAAERAPELVGEIAHVSHAAHRARMVAEWPRRAAARGEARPAVPKAAPKSLPLSSREVIPSFDGVGCSNARISESP
jgi:hypothetical protein